MLPRSGQQVCGGGGWVLKHILVFSVDQSNFIISLEDNSWENIVTL